MIEFPNNPLPNDEFTDHNGTVWICTHGNPNIWQRKTDTIGDAPYDGKLYVRKDAQWVLLANEIPFTTVPDVIGMTLYNAEIAIEDAGLILGTVTGDIDPVIDQSPAGGTYVEVGTTVDLTITSYVTAPDIIGMTAADANNAILAAGMTIGTVTGEVDPVIAQDPASGTQHPPNTPMNYTLSDIPEVAVPDIVGMTAVDGEAAILAANLVVGTVTGDIDPIIDQNPDAGAIVDIQTPVDYTLTTSTIVPDIIGMTDSAARTAITDAGLVVGTVTGTYDPVISQNPSAGTEVAIGSPVDYDLTPAETVPNIIGMNSVDADAAIIAANLIVGTVTGLIDPVQSQSPSPGTSVPPQSPVDYDLILGSYVPDIIGMTAANADAAITAANLVKGTVTGTYDPVIDQDPVSGTLVPYNTPVNYELTPPSVVPDIMGMTSSDADNAIIAADLTVGTVDGDIDPVIAQDPASGIQLAPLSPVNYTLTELIRGWVGTLYPWNAETDQNYGTAGSYSVIYDNVTLNNLNGQGWTNPYKVFDSNADPADYAVPARSDHITQGIGRVIQGNPNGRLYKYRIRATFTFTATAGGIATVHIKSRMFKSATGSPNGLVANIQNGAVTNTESLSVENSAQVLNEGVVDGAVYTRELWAAYTLNGDIVLQNGERTYLFVLFGPLISGPLTMDSVNVAMVDFDMEEVIADV